MLCKYFDRLKLTFLIRIRELCVPVGNDLIVDGWAEMLQRIVYASIFCSFEWLQNHAVSVESILPNVFVLTVSACCVKTNLFFSFFK